MDELVNNALAKGAKAALFEWKQGGIPDANEIEDLEHDMWLWLLDRPSTRQSMEKHGQAVATNMVKIAARQVLVEQALASDLFQGKNLYSSDAVKDALTGASSNRYLLELLPRAMTSLSRQNEDYAETIKSRYEDGIVPPRGSAQVTLSRAVKSLTDQVNIMVIRSDADALSKSEGAAGLSAVMPEGRSAKGAGHSDPTGEMAIKLAEKGDETIYFGEEPEYFCESYLDKDGIRRALRKKNNEVVYSNRTTTIRAEFLDG